MKDRTQSLIQMFTIRLHWKIYGCICALNVETCVSNSSQSSFLGVSVFFQRQPQDYFKVRNIIIEGELQSSCKNGIYASIMLIKANTQH
jgi:hypothetical protein